MLKTTNMFASLKNKIREETGSDLSKLTAKITSSTVQRIDSLRGKGSTSSLNSLVSSDGQKDDASETGRNDEDLKKKVQRLEAEFVKKLDEKDKELKEILNEKDKRISSLEKEKEEAYKHIHNLKESLKNVEDFKQKLVERQEDKEQIESFQTQELSKVKHLVLLREQELEDRSNQLKEATQQLEKIRSEVNRLRRFEEQLSDVQDDLESLRHSSARDMATLASDLAKSEEERRHLTDLVAILRERSSSDNSDEQFAAERKLLEQRLEEAHLHLADIKTSWSDKIASLETQVGRLSRQAAEEGSERRRAVDEKDVLLERVRQLECELECNNLELNNKDAKMKRLIMEIEELSTELKNLRSESEEEVAFLRVQIVS